MSFSFDFEPKPRRQSVGVDVGGVMVGGGAPVVVQSMTNTDTADVDATVAQVAALFRAGSEIVRITVDRDEAAIGSDDVVADSCPGRCLTARTDQNSVDPVAVYRVVLN